MLQFSENSPNGRFPRQCVSHRGEILPDKDEQGLTILFKRMMYNFISHLSITSFSMVFPLTIVTTTPKQTG